MPRAPKKSQKDGKPDSQKRPRKSAAKNPPKAAPVSVTKSAQTAPVETTRLPALSHFDMQFCDIFVRTNKQVEAWRELRPEDKDPHKAAHRMMQRPEIRAHIKDIYRAVDKRRLRAVEVSANAALLQLEVADNRLMELLDQPRRTRAEMLTRDTKTFLVSPPGFDEEEAPYPIKGKDETDEAYKARCAAHDEVEEARRDRRKDALNAHLAKPAPVEDADLLKAIKLTYERKQGIIKPEKNPAPTHTSVLLYKPKWFGAARSAPTIEGNDAPAA